MEKIKLVKAIVDSNLSDEDKKEVIDLMFKDPEKEYVYVPYYPYTNPLNPVTYEPPHITYDTN